MDAGAAASTRLLLSGSAQRTVLTVSSSSTASRKIAFAAKKKAALRAKAKVAPKVSPAKPAVTRRASILGAGAALATTPVAGVAAAETDPNGNLPAVSVDPILHLARRATWGATPDLLAEIKAVGTTKWLDAQLNPTMYVPDAAMDKIAEKWPRLSLSTWEVRDLLYPNVSGAVGYDLIQASMARAIWSKRQLFEVMVDFWTNHLVIPAPGGDSWDSQHRFNVDVLRKYALGRYSDMLVASAKHPAMLQVLDNAFSTKRAPNENYGRELLELHTVGVGGGYAETDIRTSALILTGMSTESESGEYYYKQIRHHVGPLSVMGWSHPNKSAYGEDVAVSYLTYLAKHPSTAKRLATKLATRFVADYPPAALVDRLAGVYLANNTAIGPVLRTLFTSAEFAASGGQKVKRPLEDAISTVRLLGVGPGENLSAYMSGLHYNTRIAGQAPMGWPAPNGYPDVAAAWAGAGGTLALWNFHIGQTSATTNTQAVYPPIRDLLPATTPSTYGAYADLLAQRLLVGPLSESARSAVCSFLDKSPTDAMKSTDAALSYKLPHVAALLLDSPRFTER